MMFRAAVSAMLIAVASAEIRCLEAGYFHAPCDVAVPLIQANIRAWASATDDIDYREGLDNYAGYVNADESAWACGQWEMFGNQMQDVTHNGVASCRVVVTSSLLNGKIWDVCGKRKNLLSRYSAAAGLTDLSKVTQSTDHCKSIHWDGL